MNVTCGASVSCAGLDEAYFVELLGECTGLVASHDGQECVYTEQIQDMATGATWASFSVTQALVAECTSSNGVMCDLDDNAQCPDGCTSTSNNANVMTEGSAKGKLENSAQFSAIKVDSRPDIANSRPRNLPFCPIAHPEPFPPFLLMPTGAYRTCNGAQDHPDSGESSLDCGTILATGGATPAVSEALKDALIPPADVAHAASVLLASTDITTLLGSAFGGGGGGGGFGLIDPAALLSSDGQSEVMPQLSDAVSGISLATTAIPSSQLFLDNAFFMGGAPGGSQDGGANRRRLSHGEEGSLNNGGGMMAMSAHCPTLVAEATDAIAVQVCGTSSSSTPAETCEVDPCTGYIQGTAGVPSTSCPSGCTLAGDGSTETCTATVTDCSTGYVPGDALTPSSTCPDGCIFAAASCPGLAGVGAPFESFNLAQLTGLMEGFITEGQLVPGLPLSCVNATVATHASADSIDATLIAGYFSDSLDAPNDDIREYAGGFDFRGSSASKFEVDVLFNDTNQARRGGGPPVLVRINAPMNMATGAFLTERTKNMGSQYEAKLRSLRMMPQPERSLNLDFSSLLGPLFYVWLIQLLFPVGLGVVVYEKEMRLRMMMKLMGLTDSVYWMVTYLYNLVTYCLFMIMLYVAGNLIGLAFFQLNSTSLQFLFYFIYGNTQIAFTMLVSTCFATSKTATVGSYLWVFLSGLTANVLLPFFVQSTVVPEGLVFCLELIPAFSLYRGLYELAQYAFEGVYKESPGMLWENLSDEENGMARVLLVLALECPIFIGLSLYLDKVLDSGTGVRLPWDFCLKSATARGEPAASANSDKGGAALSGQNADAVIDAAGLVKTYPAHDGGPPKTAVSGIDMTVHRGSCYGLLGQNGAGKTTTIMMLCGFQEPTDGAATVGGFSILTEMPMIYKVMGVCPQHNLLWETLTAIEHIYFYATLKGIAAEELQEVSMAALEAVSLDKVASKPCGQFSGGMKRRLSVAISLIGSPTVVFMDEPSTGLDPASRKQLWRAIRLAKKRGSCGIVLTTHSMQEAEELCDELGIIKNGKIVASGTPISLVRAYGNYLEVHMNLPPGRHSDAEALLRGLSPSLEVKSGLGGTVKYELSGAETTVQEVFATVTEHRVELEIEDWGVHNSSLEDVFVKLYGDDEVHVDPGEVRLRDKPDDVDLESRKLSAGEVSGDATGRAAEPPGTPEESEPVSA
eukprot:COSAG02_NODE_9_length_59728_cov_36.104714_16_plen_1199_part_00